MTALLALAFYLGFCLLWFLFFGVALHRLRFDDLTPRSVIWDMPLPLWPSLLFLMPWAIVSEMRRRTPTVIEQAEWAAHGIPTDDPDEFDLQAASKIPDEWFEGFQGTPGEPTAMERLISGASEESGIGPVPQPMDDGCPVLFLKVDGDVPYPPCAKCGREPGVTDMNLCVPCGLLQARLDEWDQDEQETVPDLTVSADELEEIK